MRVIIAVASKHGGTEEIGEAVATALRQDGIDADARDVDDVPDLAPFDAVILGSGVYAGHWLPEATRFAERQGAALRQRPLWLFSSSPARNGGRLRPEEPPLEAETLGAHLGAREVRAFPGRHGQHDLRAGERLLVRALHAEDDDLRDWTEVADWGHEIAESLQKGRR